MLSEKGSTLYDNKKICNTMNNYFIYISKTVVWSKFETLQMLYYEYKWNNFDIW